MNGSLRQRRPNLRVIAAVLLAEIVAIVVCLKPIFFVDQGAATLRRAERCYLHGYYAQARDNAAAVLQLNPDNALALLIAGYSSAHLSEHAAAVDYFERVPPDDPYNRLLALRGAGRSRMRLGDAAGAERDLRAAQQIDAFDEHTLRQLSELLGIEGRGWESAKLVHRLLLQGDAGGEHLLKIGRLENMVILDNHFVATCLAAHPDEPVVKLGIARTAIQQGQFEKARAILADIVARHPDMIEAQVRLGEALLAADSDSIAAWRGQLPEQAWRHPDCWFVCGRWLEERGEKRAATRCYLEALQRHSDHVAALQRAAALLRQDGAEDAAADFAERASQLAEIAPLLDELAAAPDLEIMRQASDRFESLGRDWESAGWARAALLFDPSLEWANQRVRQLRGRLRSGPPLVAANETLNRVDLSRFPLPEWRRLETSIAPPPRPKEPPPAEAEFRLANVAPQAGIQFQYQNGTTADAGLDHVLHSTGGGIGVLDYDADGWPDLYFSQGVKWSTAQPQLSSPDANDRLFRNLDGRAYEEVSHACRIENPGFGQGASVGDYDNDGFDDVFVCNVGVNRLFRNNGDGTFSLQAEDQLASREWSVSAAIADVNHDANPDIYVVNYLDLDEVLARTCGSRQSPTACPPTYFAAAQDRLYLNDGQGGFVDATDLAPPNLGGKGMGLIVGSFLGDDFPAVFVSNDMTPNALLVNEAPNGNPRFRELAETNGVAVSGLGKVQACMGIAADDVDANGLVDLLVTNFHQESNTLYLQEPGKLFTDASRRSGLERLSLDMLGFGCQFVDLELDGDPDLIVANGHLQRESVTGVDELMPTQVLVNAGGQFSELPAASWDGYFAQRHLGRALARLDWNRDGLEDVVVSHLTTPTAILENRTHGAGKGLTFELRGVKSSRQATGAQVELHVGGSPRKRHLLAGDGFAASNQRHIVFGRPNDSNVDSIIVHWPSGDIERFPAGMPGEISILVEGRGAGAEALPPASRN